MLLTLGRRGLTVVGGMIVGIAAIFIVVILELDTRVVALLGFSLTALLIVTMGYLSERRTHHLMSRKMNSIGTSIRNVRTLEGQSRDILRGLERRTVRNENKLSHVESLTKHVNELVAEKGELTSQIAEARSEIKAANDSLRRLRDQVQSYGDPLGYRRRRLYSPLRQEITAPRSGRAAATVKEDPQRQKRVSDYFQEFDELADYDRNPEANHLATIATSAFSTFLDAQGLRNESLHPSMAFEQLIRKPHKYIVIEDRALATGLWSGAANPAGMDLYREIHRVIETARKEQIPVLYIDSGTTPDVLTATLKANVDIVVTAAGVQEEWKAEVDMGVVDEIYRFLKHSTSQLPKE